MSMSYSKELIYVMAWRHDVDKPSPKSPLFCILHRFKFLWQVNFGIQLVKWYDDPATDISPTWMNIVHIKEMFWEWCYCILLPAFYWELENSR